MMGYTSPFAAQRRRPTMAGVAAAGGLGPRPAPSPVPPAPAAPPVPAAGGSPTPAPAGDPSDPFSGAHGHGWNAGRTQNQLMRLGASNAFGANPYLWSSINDLQNQAQQNPTEDLAANYGQDFEQLGNYYDQAGNRLAANLNDRGLGDSSSMVQGQAAVQGARAGGQAQLASGIRQMAQNRQLQAQASLRDLLMGLMGRSSDQAAGLAGTIQQQNYQKAMLNAQNNPFSQILGGLGGLAGTYIGAGMPGSGLRRA